MNDAQNPIDAQWIHQAVDQYERPLRQYAARLIGDYHRASDVVQDTFLKLCDQDREQIEDHLAQWLYTVTRNFSLNVNRKEKRVSQLSTTGAKLKPSREPGPDDIAMQRDDQSQAAALLDQLPESQQEVIRLKFQHGLTYRQIAKVTDHPVSTVGYLIQTGLASIRKQMTATKT